MPNSVPERIGPYPIEAEIGRGGMGVVYRARDPKLNRPVAIKVLPQEVARDPARVDRFRNEATTLAALNHPNILTVHDVDSEGGTVYVVTELLEGETLRDRLAAAPLDWRRAAEIAAAVADGLAAAHTRGIVHRDLKPENIFVTDDGIVKILDFGLARVEPEGETDEATVTRATEPGTVLGTVGYMAPEQVRGETADARADIFSFGCVFYEMITGKVAFKRDTSVESMTATLNEQPAPPRESVDDLPPGLERVLSRCLEKRPHDRFQSARDLAFSLRSPVSDSGFRSVPSTGPGVPVAARLRTVRGWLPGLAVLILGLAGLGWWLSHDSTSDVPSDTIETIAVLPFVNESGDAEIDFLGDGLADNVINRLAAVPGLRVCPRSSAFRHRGRDAELEAVAADLGVRGIVTGRVSRRGDSLVIGVELTDVRQFSQLWGERYDTSVDDILTVESDIAERITRALRIRLSGEQARQLSKRYTEVPAAHLAYLEARHAWNRRSADNFRRSLELYDRAIAADPGFALAYAGKAETYVLMMLYLGRTADYYAPLQEAVDAAIRLDPDLAQAYPVQGFLFALQQDWAGSERAFRRAIELDPKYATAQHWYGIYLLAAGDPDGRLSRLREARRLDPGSLIIATDYAGALTMKGRLDEAETILREVVETTPMFWRADEGLGRIYLLQGRFDDAVRSYEQAVSKAGVIPWTDGYLAMVYGKAGDTERALAELKLMEERAVEGYVSPIGFARAYLGLGDMDRCFEWLGRAAEEKDPLFMVGIQRMYPEMMADPRWEELERRMGYPEVSGD
jgi:serine/threonine protein kinase/tetratricopeptide (TPR) repeat protein